MISWSEKQQADLQGEGAFWLRYCAHLPLFLAGCTGRRFSDCHSSPRESEGGNQCCSIIQEPISPPTITFPTPSTQLHHVAGKEKGKGRSRLQPARPRYLYKLNMKLSCERGNLSLDTQFSLFDTHGNDLVVSRAMSNSVKNVQVLHHDMAVQANIKHLQGGRNDSVRTDSGMRQLKEENQKALQHALYHHTFSTPLRRIQRPKAAIEALRLLSNTLKFASYF